MGNIAGQRHFARPNAGGDLQIGVIHQRLKSQALAEVVDQLDDAAFGIGLILPAGTVGGVAVVNNARRRGRRRRRFLRCRLGEDVPEASSERMFLPHLMQQIRLRRRNRRGRGG